MASRSGPNARSERLRERLRGRLGAGVGGVLGDDNPLHELPLAL